MATDTQESTHPENLRRLRDCYIETAKSVDPEIHSTYNISWVVLNHLGDLSVRCIYYAEYTDDVPYPRFKRLIDAFKDQEQKLGFPLREFFPSWDYDAVEVDGKGVASVHHGMEYKVPVEDFPLELKTENERLLLRSWRMSEIKDLIKGTQSALSELRPELFEDEENITGIEEKLGELRTIGERAPEAKSGSYGDDCKRHEEGILSYLGISTDD